MDVVERLTLESAQQDTMLAREHRHRYEFAAPLCRGRRVLDLCCGSGYGSAILASHATAVVGVDNDMPTIEMARATVGRDFEHVSFEAADAVAFLRDLDLASIDAVVCFEGLEHLHQLDQALALLRDYCHRGLRLVASVPNSRVFEEHNPFHVTDFGYDDALAAFDGFPGTVMVPQYLAEGSLISPVGASDAQVSVELSGHDEPEYANHFIFCVNVGDEDVQRVTHGRIQATTAPLFNRWSVGVKQALEALRRENTRLARGRLGKSGSAAASALAGLAAREATVRDLEHRCHLAERRVRELERELGRGDPQPGDDVRAVSVDGTEPPLAVRTVAAPLLGAVAASAPGEDPNSWEHRRRRAAEFLVPWVEQTVPLAGKTVLEYGCGNAAVSCAFAERAGRLIGLDIDAHWIEYGEREIRQRGLTNVELELHPPERILDAFDQRRGQVDVVLLYAVLEHLTVAERLSVLRRAREVVDPNGAIVVCETPNRLAYFDHHTAQMPFFHLLPDELALEYYGASERADFKSAIADAAKGGHDAALERIARWGRGVSFHEFEVAFGGALDRHVLASNYDMLLFGERPIQPDEIVLSRYLQRVRPDLAPVFSRFWLDLILSPAPIQRRPPFLRPWTADTTGSPGVAWTGRDTLSLRREGPPLWVELPAPTEIVVVGVQASHSRPFSLVVRPQGESGPPPADGVTLAGGQAFAAFPLGGPASRLSVDAGDDCEVVLVAHQV